MPRELVIGNGRILINFDAGLNVRDLYYPYVGQWNHVGGHKVSFGLWAESTFAWCDDPDWRYEITYRPRCLITQIEGWNERLGLAVQINDAVHYRDNIYLKRLAVRNPYNYRRTVLVFFTHDFCIEESEVGDTAVYDPFLGTVYHYKRNFYFMANGRAQNRGIYQFATGVKRFAGAEGTWRDAEDGVLEGNPIAQGSVDSTISFRLDLAPNSETTLYYWLVCGRNYQEVRRLNQYVLEETPQNLLRRIEAYWRHWLRRAPQPAPGLPPELGELYYKSLLLVRAHMDQRGAIIAAADSDIMQFNRDHYAYAWPRDAALVAKAAIRANYGDTTEPFFHFCANALTENGYLLHKYNPDGTAGSSWHPWYQQGETQLPIQEDETALVLIALWEHYRCRRDLEFLQTLYRPLVEPAAEFMANYIYEELDLPQPSYDLWEEKRGVWTFTASAVFAALVSASRMARLFADDRQAGKYRNAAERLRRGILKYLYSEEHGRFLKGLVPGPDGELLPDPTPESSTLGVYLFGVLPPNDPRLVATVKAMEDALWVKEGVGGMARYHGDAYFRPVPDGKFPGNPWIICTLWLAQYYIGAARSLPELAKPLELLKWAARRAGKAGILPEQVHALTGEHLSVAPLTWSHSTFVETVLRYCARYKRLLRQEECAGQLLVS